MQTHYPKADLSVLRFREEQDGVILVSRTDTGKLMVINHSGFRILKLCNGENTCRDIAECLTEIFTGASLDTILKDVQDFLEVAESECIIGEMTEIHS